MRYKKLPGHRLFKGCRPLQLLCILTGNLPQTATFHTATVASNVKKDKLCTKIKEFTK